MRRRFLFVVLSIVLGSVALAQDQARKLPHQVLQQGAALFMTPDEPYER